MIFNHLATIVK